MKTIEQQIMSRVRRIYYMRTFLSPLALKLYASGVVVVLLMSLVSVPSVLANTPSDVWSGMQYLAHALLNTEFIVQALCLSVLVFAGMVVRDALRFVRTQQIITFV